MDASHIASTSGLPLVMDAALRVKRQRDPVDEELAMVELILQTHTQNPHSPSTIFYSIRMFPPQTIGMNFATYRPRNACALHIGTDISYVLSICLMGRNRRDDKKGGKKLGG